MANLWQELDLCSKEEWECLKDSVSYKKKLETKRVFKFLAGLNRGLDDEKARILGQCPPPLTYEVFSKVRQGENRQEVMLKDSGTIDDKGSEKSALITHIPTCPTPKAHKGRIWCEKFS